MVATSPNLHLHGVAKPKRPGPRCSDQAPFVVGCGMRLARLLLSAVGWALLSLSSTASRTVRQSSGVESPSSWTTLLTSTSRPGSFSLTLGLMRAGGPPYHARLHGTIFTEAAFFQTVFRLCSLGATGVGFDSDLACAVSNSITIVTILTILITIITVSIAIVVVLSPSSP